MNTSTAQKIKLSIKELVSKCDQIRRKLKAWSHLPKKSLMENFFFLQWSKKIPETYIRAVSQTESQYLNIRKMILQIWISKVT